MANDSLMNATLVDHGGVVVAAMATVYAVICAAGLVGHGLVLLVIVRDRHQPSRAVSNSYIASLSAADIGFLLGLPFIIATLSARRWLFGASLCKVKYGAASGRNSYVRSITIISRSSSNREITCTCDLVHSLEGIASCRQLFGALVSCEEYYC